MIRYFLKSFKGLFYRSIVVIDCYFGRFCKSLLDYFVNFVVFSFFNCQNFDNIKYYI
jgi:hypothetical protein